MRCPFPEDRLGQLLRRLALIGVVIAATPIGALHDEPLFLSASPALADEDDDGDDSGDAGSSGDDGGSDDTGGDDDDADDGEDEENEEDENEDDDEEDETSAVGERGEDDGNIAIVNRPGSPALQVADEIVAIGLGDDELGELTARGYRIVTRRTLGGGRGELAKLRVPDGRTLDEARAEIAALDDRVTTDFNHFYRTEAGEPCTGLHCASLELVDWPVAAGAGASCSADARIGIVDTGVNADHATFASGSLEVVRIAGPDVERSGQQHGTAVVALLVGARDSRAPGLVPDADIVAVDAFYRGPRDDERSEAFLIVEALDILAERGVSVVNMSLSGPPNALLEAAIASLTERGIVVVAASGNEGPRAEPVFPAAYPDVVAVTAVDRGLKVYRRAGQGAHIDFAAPGVDVWTAASISGVRTKTGTSYAAPFVTAAVALAQNGAGARDVDDVVALLADTAMDLGEPGRDSVFGHGLIQAADLCRRSPAG